MAIYRNVQLSFWTDNKVEDDFTPEDKYFYIYLLTNPQTNICGCYEVSFNQMTRQTGYNKETILRLIERFENTHKVIKYNKETKEILLINWYKYNWSKSEKTLVGVENVARHIKCDEFREYVNYIISCIRNDTPIMGHICPIQASVSDTDTDSDTDSDSITDNKKKDKIDNKDTIKRIIDYLNDKCGTRYSHKTEKTIGYINARLESGYTEDDFYTVIDKKCEDWIGTEFEKYLRPSTLFTPTNFESYINQKITNQNNSKENINASRQSQLDYLLHSIEEAEKNE